MTDKRVIVLTFSPGRLLTLIPLIKQKPPTEKSNSKIQIMSERLVNQAVVNESTKTMSRCIDLPSFDRTGYALISKRLINLRRN